MRTAATSVGRRRTAAAATPPADYTPARKRKKKTPTRLIEWRLDMSEDDFETVVVDMAKQLGLRSMHIRKARKAPDAEGNQRWVSPVAGDGRGWPDWSFFGEQLPGGPPAGLFWELKTTTGRVSPEQKAWIAWLRAAGFNAAVRRPADLLSGVIEKELRALSGRSARAAAARAGVYRRPPCP